MKRSTYSILTLVLLPLLAACGGTEAVPGKDAAAKQDAAKQDAPGAPAPWPSELFLVRPQGASGPLLAYDMADGSARFALPAGLASADGRAYFSARVVGKQTEVSTFDPTTGSFDRAFPLRGRWSLSAASPTGLWLALTRTSKASGNRGTEVAVVDSASGRIAHRLTLRGTFEVETLSASGDSLFLVQHLRGDRYLVRLYDLAKERLVANPLRAKGADEFMAGYAWGGTASPDGRWLLTLYLSTRRDVAFVHALDLVNRVPVCIDLPSGSGDLELLERYTLTLSPDGKTLYAANPALGVVADIDLSQISVTGRVAFTAQDVARSGLDSPVSRSVLSPDGRLYFAAGPDVWVYDPEESEVRGPFGAGVPVAGLGLSGDGKRLYVASTDGRPLVFDAQTGRALSFPA